MTQLDGVLAQLRRLYHHRINGGVISAEDISYVIQRIEDVQMDLSLENVDAVSHTYIAGYTP